MPMYATALLWMKSLTLRGCAKLTPGLKGTEFLLHLSFYSFLLQPQLGQKDKASLAQPVNLISYEPMFSVQHPWDSKPTMSSVSLPFC